MKKFLKILFALIIVTVVGVIGLITLIDPNEYRSYMVQQVKQKTGYQLALNGDLRWHVWPQVSILVDGVILTAPEAKEAMIKAENMRLDVELMPLFSKKISVKEVLLKGAVIRLTDKTKTATVSNTADNATTTNSQSRPSDEKSKNAQNWTLGLEKLEIADSTVVLQQSENPDDLLTIRNINASLAKQSEQIFDVKTDLSVNRNQNDLTTSLKGRIDFTAFPQAISTVVNELTYQVNSSALPANGLAGTVSAKGHYVLDTQQITLSDLKATVNDNSVEGLVNLSLTGDKALATQLNIKTTSGTLESDISGSLGDIPDLVIKLVGTNVDIDKLVSSFSAKDKSVQTKNVDKPTLESTNNASSNKNTGKPNHELTFLNDLNAKLSLQVNSIIINGLILNNVAIEANNQQGNVQLAQISTDIFGGSVTASGSINAKSNQPVIQLTPNITNIDMDALTETFNLTPMLSGKLNMQGKMSGTGVNANAIQTNWNATLTARVVNARLNNLNLQQIIHQAASLSSKGINAEERYEQYTQLQTLSAAVQLQKGVVHLSHIDVDSKGLVVKGDGTINLANMACDISLNTKLLQGWSGKKDIVEILQSTTIPVHIYGPCDHLSYKVSVDQLFKDQLQQQATKALDKYLGINNAQKKEEAANKIFSQILGKR